MNAMKWTRSENVVWEELDEATLLVDARSGKRWSLDGAVSVAWKLCDGTRTIAELSRILRQSEDHIASMCAQLERKGLLIVCGALPGDSSSIVGFNSVDVIKPLGLGSGPRRRPSPRGVSGPG